jgi:hypothetical protein
MDNVQNCDNYINTRMPSSQTYISNFFKTFDKQQTTA